MKETNISLSALLEEAREKTLDRVKSAREFNWEGGFKPEFLADFVERELTQAVHAGEANMLKIINAISFDNIHGQDLPKRTWAYNELELFEAARQGDKDNKS